MGDMTLDLTPRGAASIEALVNGPIQTNSYAVISNDECLIVDPAWEGERLVEHIRTAHPEVRVLGSVCTHGHADHVGGVAGEGQKRHSEADQHADQGQALFAVEEIQGSPFLYVKINRSHSILRRACARAGPQACGDDKAEHAQNAIRNGKQCKPRQSAAKPTPCRMRRMRAESP